MVKRDGPASWLLNAALVVAIAAWVVDFVLGILMEGYRGSESVNMIFLAVVSGVVALRIRDDDDDDDDDDEPRRRRTR
jgi:hypothetical protein